MGRLATMLGDIQAAKTPLERRVDQLGRQIARWVLALAAVLGLLGIVAEGLGRAPEMIIFAVALAVAAVPEGLPAVLTVALALGVERMARHRAVVRRLSAVEALGSVTVIATDKTGTLTESRMDVRIARCVRPAARARGHRAGQRCGPDDRRGRSARVSACCAMPPRTAWTSRGCAQEHPLVAERPFDSAWKFAARHGAGGRAAGELPQGRARGRSSAAAPCRPRTANPGWRRPTRTRARGFACWRSPGPRAKPKSTLSLLGLVLFWDPPRPEVPDAVAHGAGRRASA